MRNVSEAVSARPAYRDLPLLDEGSDYRHAWEFWGKGDPLGCLNDITPQARARGLAAVRASEVVNVTLPLTLPDPPLFGRGAYTHTVFPPSKRNFVDEKVDGLFPQRSTQWDGFRHLHVPGHGFFGGVDVEPGRDLDTISVHHWAERGIITRGVLVDVSARIRPALDAAPDEPVAPVEAEELRAAVAASGVEPAPGDLLCVRTGWMAHYLEADAAERERVARRATWPGLSGSAEVAELLWDWGVAAVAADNPGVECSPGSRAAGSLHRRLLALLGMPFGELFDFETLHRRLGEAGHNDFLFVAVPLNLPGGAGSTGNAVALI
ncbi:cyclase family protein [Thermocatellispora tengchongensis]